MRWGSKTLLLIRLWALVSNAAAQESIPRTAGTTAQQSFDSAIRELRSGQPLRAAIALTTIGEATAGGPPELAAEALFKAAQIYEDQLNNPELARQLYIKTAQRYPRSRFAQRSVQRGAELDALMRTDPKVLAEFNHIASDYLTLGMPTVIARLNRILAAHPEFPQADRATYLLGTAYRDAGPEFVRDAERTLWRVIADYVASPWAPYAHRALADLALHHKKYNEARQHFRALLHYPEPLWSESAREGLWACTVAQGRQLAMLWCWIYLVVFGGKLMFQARHQLLPPPMEVLYYAPVATFFLLVSFTKSGAYVRGAMAGLALGGSILSWLSGAASRRPGRLWWGLVSRLLAGSAVCYLALYHGGLLDRLIETWRMGPESG